jgi:uncharacterized protein
MKNQKSRELSAAGIMRLIRQHKDLLDACMVKRIGLFGSYARGEQRRDSDIDFMVEFRKPDFDAFMDLAFALEDIFGKKVELITPPGLSPHLKPIIEKEVRWYEN